MHALRSIDGNEISIPLITVPGTSEHDDEIQNSVSCESYSDGEREGDIFGDVGGSTRRLYNYIDRNKDGTVISFIL